MIRVLLVDDELLSRMTVRSLINWEKGLYHLRECSDGTQAWAAIPSFGRRS
ncbi:MAG: response regulator transcription factor [Eisenbergiella massiliensis]